MPRNNHEHDELLAVLKLIDAHRHAEIDADQLERAIWRVRSRTSPIDGRWIWTAAAGLLAAATLFYVVS
jgi:hypothetical protein